MTKFTMVKSRNGFVSSYLLCTILQKQAFNGYLHYQIDGLQFDGTEDICWK